MRQVACVVTGEPTRQRLTDCPGVVCGKQLMHVADLGSKVRGALCPARGVCHEPPYSFIAEPQPATLTTIVSEPASASIVLAGKRCRSLLEPDAALKCAATMRLPRSVHLPAPCGQHRDCRRVHVAKKDAVDTTLVFARRALRLIDGPLLERYISLQGEHDAPGSAAQ
jgi:hypothetical protein